LANIFLDSLLSQRMTDGVGYLPAPWSPSPTHLYHPRCKAGVHSSLSWPKKSPSGMLFKYRSNKQ
jgi:hypothetical protein